MDKLWDKEYLLNQQYRDASNLNAGYRLHRDFSTNTAVEPLIDYVQSTSRLALDEAGQAALRRLAGAEIERCGALRIPKAAGLFIATK